MRKAIEISGDSHEVQANITEMKKAYESALNDECQGMKDFYKKNPEALFNTVTVSRDTAFHIAATKGCAQQLKEFLEMVPAASIRDVLTKKDVHGNTPLHQAATTNSIEAVKLLVEKLFELGDAKKTIQEKQIREREDLLKVRNNLGETPLYRAAAFGKKQILKYLVEKVEQVGDMRDHYHRFDLISILHIAVTGQHFETAIWLLKRDRNLGLRKEQSGMTCFQLLASMQTAFRSSCPKYILQAFTYFWLPNFSAFDDDDDEEGPDQIPSRQREDIESGKHTNSFQHCLYRSKPSKGSYIVNEILKLKRKHESANKLAKMLVNIDISWAITHQIDDRTICIEEGRSEKELAPKTALSTKKTSSQPDTPLLIAASNGIHEIVDRILDVYPQAVEHVSMNGQNILHVAVMYRQLKVFDSIEKREMEIGKLAMIIDNNGYTILHHAADTSFYSGGTRTGAAFQFQEELKLFERVKNLIPSHYAMHRNKDGVTAQELFKIMHKDQYDEAKQWISKISTSCSTVAALVAPVVFAAAFGVPGGFRGEAKGDNSHVHQGKRDNSTAGLPILLNKPLYSAFTVFDVTSLAASFTSVVLFLSILTSSGEQKDFLHSLPRKLTLAFNFLFFSVAAAMSAFSTTILLTVQPKKQSVKILTYVATFLPISMFIISQFPLYVAFLANLKDILAQICVILLPRAFTSHLPPCLKHFT